jgi:hypothetical protein
MTPFEVAQFLKSGVVSGVIIEGGKTGYIVKEDVFNYVVKELEQTRGSSTKSVEDDDSVIGPDGGKRESQAHYLGEK